MAGMKITTSILAVALMLAHPVLGQADATALETALHGKPLGLRSYSVDPVATYTWLNGKLVPGAIQLHGMAAFFADTVRQKGSKITIEGQSSILVRNEGKLAPMGRVPMRLEIDLQGADAATVYPKLQAELFFPNMQSALGSLPEFVSDMLPFPADGKFQSTCHCSHIFQDGKWVKLTENDPKLTAPGFIKMSKNPSLNQMAIDAKVSGTITLIYYVNDIGRVDEVWLAKPLGPLLDESAAKSGRENLLRPATYDGKPVGTVLVQTISAN